MWVLIVLVAGSGYPGSVALTQVRGFDTEVQCRDAGKKVKSDLYVTFSCVETQRK